jgi:spermidine synthase
MGGTSSQTSRYVEILILLAFGLSGVATLMYEVLWVRPLSLVFGSTVYATSAMLAAMMAGFMLGSYLFRKYAERVRNPLRLFFFLEVGTGLYGILIIWLFTLLPPMLFGPLQLLVSFSLVVVPASLIGATWPVAAKSYVREKDKLGRGIGQLYSVNSFGCAFGAFAAGFLLLPALGVRNSCLVAAFLNFSSAVLLLVCMKLWQETEKRAEIPAEAPTVPGGGGMRRTIFVAFVFSGMVALMYEVVWTRPLSVVFGSSSYSLATILAAFMTGLAIGGWAGGKYADRVRNPAAVYALLLLGIGIYGMLLLPSFNHLPSIFSSIYGAFHSNFSLFTGIQFFLVFLLLLPATCLMGATTPVVAKFYTERVGRDVGTLYAGNTLGAMFGSLSAGFLFIPLLGIKWSIVLASLVNLFLGYLILLCSSRTVFKKLLVGLILPLFICASVGYDIRRLSLKNIYYPSEEAKSLEVLYYREGVYGTVVVLKMDGTKSLMIDGKGNGGTNFSDIRLHYLSAYLPLLLHPKPERALVVGLGTGTASGLISQYCQTVTVEIDPEIVEVPKYFSEMNKDVLHNENFRLVLADARNYLATTKEKYDLIISIPSDPWTERSTNLFSKEFFELLRNHLKENGILAQWLPLYSLDPETFKILYRTFNTVFPHVIGFGNMNVKEPENRGGILWYPAHLILLGSTQPLELDWFKIVMRMARDPRIYRDLYFAWAENPQLLENMLLFTSEQMKGYGEGYPVITDDRPLLEFRTARILVEKTNPLRVLEDIKQFCAKTLS